MWTVPTCRNHPGIARAHKYGYSLCSNAVDHLYASSPIFATSTIVHELMHPFGLSGSGDHYGTDTCKEQMGWDEAAWTFDPAEAQRFAGMCPHAYDNFVSGYQP